ncbi:MAG: STAS domain-containing protein [Methylococcales bacterium]|nr:STAS domain-containing protein [Methylococcales bacterium]
MTTNNLIGYDPLAWMDGAELEEETPEPVAEPTKKATKSRAKAKATPVEVVEEPIAQEPVIAADTVEANETEESLEVEVKIDEEGDVEITVEASADDEVSVEVSIEENEDDVIESVVQEIAEQVEEPVAIEEMPVQEIPVQEEIAEQIEESEAIAEMPAHEEEVAMAEEIVEEAPVESLAEPHIDLEPESTIKNVAQLYSTVKNSLAAHDVIEINAADVTTIDTATLQLLVSLKKDAPNLGKTVDIIYPSERFIESAKLLGLLEILGV